MKSHLLVLARSAGSLMVILGLLTGSPAVKADLDIQSVGHWPGPLRTFYYGSVAVVGRHAYVTGAFSPGLYVFDVGDPGPPRLVGTLRTMARTIEIAVAGGYAFVTDAEGRMLVADITDPARPRLVSVFDTHAEVYAIAVSGSYAYLPVYSSSDAAANVVQIVDVSDPTTPRVAGEHPLTNLRPVGYELGFYRYLVAAENGFLCVAGKSNSGSDPDTMLMEVVDVSNPADPRKVGEYETTGRATGLTVANGRAYFAPVAVTESGGRLASVQVIDLGDPSGPKLLGEYTTPGNVISLTWAGNFLYAAGESSGVYPPLGVVDVLDVTDPALPVLVGGTTTVSSSSDPEAPWTHTIPRIAVADGVACLATSQELRSFDVSEPSNLLPLGTLTLEQWTADIAVSGNHVFTADISALSILDANEATNLTRIGKINAPYPADRVVVSGNYAYLAGSKGLFTFDVSNPAAPQQTGTYSVYAWDLAVSGNLLFVVEYGAGLHVLDLANPATPLRVAKRATRYQSATSVAVSGSYAFVVSADYESERVAVEVLDVSAPSRPRLVGTYNTTGSYGQIAVSGHLALLVHNDVNKSEILDVSQPTAPTRLATYMAEGFKAYYGRPMVSLVDHRAFIPASIFQSALRRGGYTTGLEVIDLSEPTRPRRIGGSNSAGSSFILSRENLLAANPGVQNLRLAEATLHLAGVGELGSPASGITVEGSHAYVAAGTAGLQVVSLENSSEPSLLGSAPLDGTAWDVAVSDHRAYVAAGDAGLVVVDVGNPEAPQIVGAYDTPGDARSVLLSGSTAYVADGPEGMQILDVSDPAHIQRLSGQATTGWAAGLAKHGNRLLVACREAGLAVLDVSDPANPQLISTYNRGGYILAVAVAGDHALVSDGMEGFTLLDLTDPTALRSVGVTPSDAGPARGIAVSGHFAYVGVTQSGVEVYDLTDPTRPRRVGGNSALAGYGLTVAGDRLFVAGGQRGLGVFALFAPLLRLGTSSAQTPGTISLQVSGPPGSTARIQWSDDLHNWKEWQSVTFAAQPQTLTDSTSGPEVRRFYRAVMP